MMAMQENRRDFGLQSVPSAADCHLSHQSSDSATSSGDSQYFYREKIEGYDYEFVPPPDSKYECSICLLVLREPRQTKCGHRFCKGCIVKWLRESQPRCPVDNEPIEEKDLFSDNFAKREIQNFNVKCPNYKQGCDHITVLKDIHDHVARCDLALVPCPNGCGEVLLRRDIPEHSKSQCGHRQVFCSYCQKQLMAQDLARHNATCPAVVVKCDYCQEEMKREQLSTHLDSECPRAVVSCPFHSLGCDAKMERCQQEQHLVESIQPHMLQMCQALDYLLRQLGLPRPPHPTQGLIPEEVSGSTFAPLLSSLLSSLQLGGLGQGDEGSGRGVRTPSGAAMSSSSRTLFKTAESLSQSLHRPQEAGRLSYTSRAGSDLGILTSPGGADPQSLVTDPEFQSLKNRNVFQDESLARHEQQLLELVSKNEMLERQNRELSRKVRSVESALSDWEGRACNGVFFWKIGSYSKVRRSAEQGDQTALHSPAFYSSIYGYKLCIRVNLNGVDSATGSHLSIFIHFMQGDYDNLLDWPFMGRIILSVVDQNPAVEQRRHISETLISKPDLAAFQRPSTARNHKGFGYMEFVSLAQVERGHYIVNDTLVIKAQVLIP